jgi:type VI secretion system secreted protein VgrG
MEQEVKTGTYAHNDYDFTNPKKRLLASSRQQRPNNMSDFELYDYPGHYTQFKKGEDWAKVRIEELQARHQVVQGQSDARGIAPGYTFTLSNHPRSDQNKAYLVFSASHEYVSEEFQGGDLPAGEGDLYSCTFRAIDEREPYRAPRLTPKPLVEGPQTAVVVGKAGEEIWTDQYGRVKVQFHWDRYGKSDENSSCWVRVSHGWAGGKWGAIYLPRIGQEVIVEFLEGDPDRPIITGRVYNGQNMPPYELPAQKTKSTLKSNSSKGW